MKFTVNIQRRNRRNAPIGEDAYPYASDGLLFVADGLGGSGGFIHKEIDQAFYDKEKALRKILKVFPEASKNGPVARYAEEAFSDVFKEGRAGESAYFASRFLALATIYAFEEAKIFDAEKISAADGSEDRRFAEILKNYLEEKELALANEIGLDPSLIPQGMLFMPSTFCLVLYKENADCIDVLVLYAGDSRAYCWDSDGLKVLTADHNDESRMMNNLMKPFGRAYLEPRRYRLKKPCAVFAASDGIYDSIYTQQPLYLEVVLFEPFAKVYERFSGTGATDEKKIVAVAEKIKEDYSGDLGSHDDSNTLAMATFGYPGFDAFAQIVKKRLTHIENLHPQWDKYLYIDADIKGEESRINRRMLTRIYAEYPEAIKRVYLADKYGEEEFRGEKTSKLSDFCLTYKRPERYRSQREASTAMSKKYFTDFKKTVLPTGLKAFGKSDGIANERELKDFWYKNGARLVCESIAGVGEGKSLKINVKDMLFPKEEQHIKEVYGSAYLVRKELKKMMDAYDKQHYSLVRSQGAAQTAEHAQ